MLRRQGGLAGQSDEQRIQVRRRLNAAVVLFAAAILAVSLASWRSGLASASPAQGKHASAASHMMTRKRRIWFTGDLAARTAGGNGTAAPRSAALAAFSRARGRHAAPARTWKVRSGQTLSTVAAQAYGAADTWPALWWVNKTAVRDPNSLRVGQVLKLSRWHPVAGWLYRAALKSMARRGPPARAQTASMVTVAASLPSTGSFPSHGVYSYSMMRAIWMWAGGPSWAADSAAIIATCESGGRTWAYNPSGASGLWQILGAPSGWTGSTDWFDARVNALAAVTKFRQAGDTFAPWVCKA